MAKVTFQTADHELRREEKGITFWARNSGGQVGSLVVSKGGLRWYPGRSRKKHHFMRWEQFGNEMPKLVRATT
jgi:hypothetical protein